MNGMDKVALRIWSDFGEIGLYSVAFRIATVFLLFQQAFCTFWAPTSYRWFENGVSLEKYEKVSEYISTILSILAILIILSRKWIVLIFSSEYSSASVLIPFLILYPILYTISETTMMGINFMRRTELGIWVTGAAALFNLGGNWLLVPRFGALGAAVATAVSYVIFFWTRTLISRQIWETFKIKVHIQNISLVILASTLTLIEYKVGSPFVVIIQIIILILIMFLNSKIVSEIFNLSKQIVLSYFRKAK
jgi:O-antigen/teichoic acid export membrane protein